MGTIVVQSVGHVQLLGTLWAAMLSCFSHTQLFATLWTVALQAPLSRGFSMQEYWNACCCHFLPQWTAEAPVIQEKL